jgi:hypothetical protein
MRHRGGPKDGRVTMDPVVDDNWLERSMEIFPACRRIRTSVVEGADGRSDECS